MSPRKMPLITRANLFMCESAVRALLRLTRTSGWSNIGLSTFPAIRIPRRWRGAIYPVKPVHARADQHSLYSLEAEEPIFGSIVVLDIDGFVGKVANGLVVIAEFQRFPFQEYYVCLATELSQEPKWIGYAVQNAEADDDIEARKTSELLGVDVHPLELDVCDRLHLANEVCLLQRFSSMSTSRTEAPFPAIENEKKPSLAPTSRTDFPATSIVSRRGSIRCHFTRFLPCEIWLPGRVSTLNGKRKL